jgi:hypothetical protein
MQKINPFFAKPVIEHPVLSLVVSLLTAGWFTGVDYNVSLRTIAKYPESAAINTLRWTSWIFAILKVCSVSNTTAAQSALTLGV